MRYFLILFLICSVMIFPGEEKKSKLVVKQLMPETQKEEAAAAPTGERDPFMDLLKTVQIKEDKLENWPIADMKLEGIIKMKDGHFRALLVSPKGKAFFVTVGAKLYDGEVVEINIEKVVFKKGTAPPTN